MRQFYRLSCLSILTLLMFLHMTVFLSEGVKTTYEDVSKSLMSPVCPGKMLSDCPSLEGSQLREVVKKQIKEGKTKEEIISYFVEVYGKTVLSVPPSEGFLITSWLLPFIVFLSGLIIFAILIFSWLKNEEEVLEEKNNSKFVELDSRVERELNNFDA